MKRRTADTFGITPTDRTMPELCTPPAVCSECGRPHFKLRERMPVSHALETISGVLIDRLDGRLEAVAALVHEHLTDHMNADACERLAIRIIQDLQVLFFPSAFCDGEPYTPDERGRMEKVADWIPRVPMLSIYARHLVESEREKAAGRLRMPDGSALLSDAELVRLAERREARGGRAVAV